MIHLKMLLTIFLLFSQTLFLFVISIDYDKDNVFTSIDVLLKGTEHSIHPRNTVDSSFYYGVATAAYQIEGASNSDGRGSSIWDTFSSVPGNIANNDNGNIADDSYHKIKEDIQLVKSMGLNAYRFSISWSRIFPLGSGRTNQLGIDHYNVLINEALLAGLTPFVTLYHWDLPQGLEDRYQGWLDGEQIERDFVNYADLCFRLYGDRVKHWVTINEPWTMSFMGYGSDGVHAPGRCSNRDKCKQGDTRIESYVVAHNVLNTHAATVELYRTQYQSKQQGQIGIVLNLDWAEPYTSSSEDITAAERRRLFQLGWFGDPIFFGKYPEPMIQEIGTRLPVFTLKQRQRLLDNIVDFLGLNHYSTRYFSNTDIVKDGEASTGWSADQHTVESKYDIDGILIGPQAESPWLNTVPWGFYKVLMWVHHRYSDRYIHTHQAITSNMMNNKDKAHQQQQQLYQSLPIYVTENGCDAPNESEMPFPDVLKDQFRINYLSSYLDQLQHSISDGVNVKGYFVWSLFDNFEWADGYAKRFGIVYVDFNDPLRKRYRKASSYWYADYVTNHTQLALTTNILKH